MHFWKQTLQSLSQQKQSVLLYVLESKGSSPGRQGFKMLVAENGKMMGSIGGGMMEHKLVELAKYKLQNSDSTIVFKQQIHSKTAANNQSGMICSGEQSVALLPLSQKDSYLIEQLLNCLQKGETAELEISPKGWKLAKKEPNKAYTFNFKDEENWLYKEKIGFKKYAYIIGGGHVSKALTKVLLDLQFHCTVIDDRDHLHTLENNVYAHQKIIVPYAEVEQQIPEGKEVFIFIMTFGYRSDLLVLQKIINKKVAFKGMMGSKEKVKQLMQEMKTLGYSEVQLANVHSPIGLNIKSRTPQEIAISIAAQLILLENKDLP